MIPSQDSQAAQRPNWNKDILHLWLHFKKYQIDLGNKNHYLSYYELVIEGRIVQAKFKVRVLQLLTTKQINRMLKGTMRCFLSESQLLCATISPVRHGPTLSDGIAPQVETHADNGAGQEDGEHHQGAYHQVEEGIEKWAAGRKKKHTKSVYAALEAIIQQYKPIIFFLGKC